MTIQELNTKEIQELNPFNELTEEQLLTKYKGIHFVKEDFFSNIQTNNNINK